jgi:hypothetical protein
MFDPSSAEVRARERALSSGPRPAGLLLGPARHAEDIRDLPHLVRILRECAQIPMGQVRKERA